MNDLALDRRKLLQGSAMVLFSGVLVQLLPFGKSKALACVDDITGEIARNHGHVAVVPASSLELDELSIDIKGQATHNHLITLNREQLQTLKDQKTLTIETSIVLGHSHTVTFFADHTLNG